ncbi:MAG: ATP-dependent Clp protease adapter ClpS [Flavobacteriaceae bacterium]|jgi:ATP-dependent Clp protease adaptor protein ClpS
MIPEDHKSIFDTDLLIDEPELKEPPLYQVILLNDDYTPMDFVIFALQKVFALNYERATEIMLAVHTKGLGVCGIFPKEIAEMKALEMNQLAKDHQHPLLTEIEPLQD